MLCPITPMRSLSPTDRGPAPPVFLALMTVEGENDDISGIGQTEATHALCTAIPDHRRVHYVQKGVGHYGVFNGSRFRSEIVPRISDFMLSAADTKPKLVAAAE